MSSDKGLYGHWKAYGKTRVAGTETVQGQETWLDVVMDLPLPRVATCNIAFTEWLKSKGSIDDDRRLRLTHAERQ